MKFLQSFRTRLLIILALLLVATLSVQYYLNLQIQEENQRISELQDQALLAGFAIGVNGMQQGDDLADFVKDKEVLFYNEKTKARILDILVINNDWEIYNSLSEKYLPVRDEKGEIVSYQALAGATDLPPLSETREKLGESFDKFPNGGKEVTNETDAEAHVLPVETSDGRWHVMIILKTNQREMAKLAAQPMAYLLGILLFSTLITVFLVWRFSRPISNLSKAARRVANGDLNFRLDESKRSDEIGQLASQFNDMTAELEKSRDLQKKLQESEKSAVVGRLASAIAHEIRNPLNYINLSLDHLRKKFQPEDDSKRENFEKLTTQLKIEVDRINQQISEFLRYSRPVKLNIQPINIREVVEDSLRLVEPQAGETDIKISLVERESAPHVVLGDSEVLRSVFNNLFINSTHAMEKDGGNLNIIVSASEDSVKIEIKDSGNGIPQENLEKIFEPYFSTKETGTGLGLAIVKRIVDDHNGKIEVESEKNVGTTFIVELPKSVNHE